MLLELSSACERLRQVHEELLDTRTTMQESQQKLEQERVELEQTIKEPMNRLYGRRSELHKVSPDQLPLDFGEEDVVEACAMRSLGHLNSPTNPIGP